MATNLNIFTCMAVMAAQVCVAAPVFDPTRPPNYHAADGIQPESNSVLTLQSVTLGSQMKAAVISGKSIKLGETIDGSRLIKVSEDRVVLVDSQGKKQTLTMDYVIHKKMAIDALPTVKNQGHK